MGFLNKIMGLGGAKSDSKKEEIRGIFNSKVEDGESYTVLAAMNMVTTKKLFEEVRTYYNYIIGYKDGDDPELIIISTDCELSAFEAPVRCKKSECQEAGYLEKMCLFTITHPDLGSEPLNFAIIGSTAWGGHIIQVAYVDEFMPFMEFYQNRFMK